MGFPAHALIVRPHVGDPGVAIAKGVRDPAQVHHYVELAASASSDGRARIETDMRAHMNPTRMAELALVAERLARRLATLCPLCSAPGWGRVDVITGLPCEDCGSFTDLVAAEFMDAWRATIELKWTIMTVLVLRRPPAVRSATPYRSEAETGPDPLPRSHTSGHAPSERATPEGRRRRRVSKRSGDGARRATNQ